MEEKRLKLGLELGSGNVTFRIDFLMVEASRMTES